jgi:CGNR zinc finger
VLLSTSVVVVVVVAFAGRHQAHPGRLPLVEHGAREANEARPLTMVVGGSRPPLGWWAQVDRYAERMSWRATSRYCVDLAPGGLALVQDFLNTASAGRPRQPDLLADASPANEWMAAALAMWADQWNTPVLDGLEIARLTERDLSVLRRARSGLLASLRFRDFGAGGDAVGSLDSLSAAVEAGFGPDGTAYFKPKGHGWKLLLGPIALEMRRAQDADLWARLKTCKNDRCRGAFYDRSRNNSGVWHGRECGNAANLRASRERRRQAAAPAVREPAHMR